MDITIKKAENVHFKEVLTLLKDCGQDLRSKGILQWDENYPDEKVVLKDLENGNLFVALSDDKIVGTIVLNEHQDAEYQQLNWLTDNSSKNLVVHRLAVLPSCQGKGIAQKLMDFSEDFAKTEGYDSIRLDTLSINLRNVSFYLKRGYLKIGQVFLSYKKEEPYVCIEKILSLGSQKISAEANFDINNS